MSMNLVTTLYLIASICFIQALKGLSHPTTSHRGTVFDRQRRACACRLLSWLRSLVKTLLSPYVLVLIKFPDMSRRNDKCVGALNEFVV